MPSVAVDTSDASGPELRGWGRYTAKLLEALRARNGAGGFAYEFLSAVGPGPELLWEQLSLPRVLKKLDADLVHAPNCFLPLRPAQGHRHRRSSPLVGLSLPQLQEEVGQCVRRASAMASRSGEDRRAVERLRAHRRQRQPRHLPFLPGMRLGRTL